MGGGGVKATVRGCRQWGEEGGEKGGVERRIVLGLTL